jgi:hypothetical protein
VGKGVENMCKPRIESTDDQTGLKNIGMEWYVLYVKTKIFI